MTYFGILNQKKEEKKNWKEQEKNEHKKEQKKSCIMRKQKKVNEHRNLLLWCILLNPRIVTIIA
jgi:hypothetical protein